MVKEDANHERVLAAATTSDVINEDETVCNDGEDLGDHAPTNSSGGRSSIKNNKAKSCANNTPTSPQQEKRCLAQPKCKQKKIPKEAAALATGDGNNTNDMPSPNQSDDQQLAWACAAEELENKRKGKQNDG